MKISLIATVLNEENSIGVFLDSVLKQSRLPDEVVIVDGGSSDLTVANIKSKMSDMKYKLKFKIINKKGNRSVGRNTAIKNSTFDIIAISDVGCILDKNWIANIVKPFYQNPIDVVAGYYAAKAKTLFQKSLAPYVLVMPDKVNSDNFLPSTRSMALRKSAWRKLNGFNEKLSHNEDYEFALRIKKSKIKSVFAKNAIVYWIPRKNLKEAFVMFFRFALGDAEAGILRPKAALIYVRYLTLISLVLLYLVTKSNSLLSSIYLLVSTYLFWSILKNYKYVNHPKAFLYLPALQLVSDAAVFLGTPYGIIKKIMR